MEFDDEEICIMVCGVKCEGIVWSVVDDVIICISDDVLL